MSPYDINNIKDLNLYKFLENTSKKFPDNPSLAFVGEKHISYKEFNDKVLQLAFSLQKHGVTYGSKVAIWSENSPNWLISYFAIVSLGAVAVPILPDFSAKEVENILKHSEAKVLFVSKSLYRKLYLEGAIMNKIIILLKDFTMHINKDGKTKKESDFEAFCDKNKEGFSDFKVPDVNINDLASIIYTSGTTGTSKGVMLTHSNLVSNTIQGYHTFNITDKDRFLSILPMSHTLEFTLGNIFPVMCGAQTNYITKPPTAAVLMPAFKKVRPTIMLTVPLIIEKIFKSKVRPELTNSSVKKFLYGISPIRKMLHRIAGKRLMSTFGGELKFYGIGGAKLDKDVEQFLYDAKFPYAIGYGLTETSPLLAGTTPGKCKVGSTGPVVINSKIKIINVDKETGEGEIVAYGPNIMKGYYKADDLNKEVFTEDGGFRTGDTGIFDKDGYLYIKGRIKNMILGPSGENIFPEQIEAEINKSEWVLESLVYELKGRIVARVELNYDEINKSIKQFRDKASDKATEMEEEAQKILTNIKKSVNEEVNKFSRLSNIFEQKEPFVKTPTKKIKRFLYHDKGPDENPEVKED
jgi:long-chain acyl-CoA synthetase